MSPCYLQDLLYVTFPLSFQFSLALNTITSVLSMFTKKPLSIQNFPLEIGLITLDQNIVYWKRDLNYLIEIFSQRFFVSASMLQVRIECGEYISKIAVYQQKVAVQLPNRIVIYEHHQKNGSQQIYCVSTQISVGTNYSLLVLTSTHVILCQVN